MANLKNQQIQIARDSEEWEWVEIQETNPLYAH